MHHTKHVFLTKILIFIALISIFISITTCELYSERIKSGYVSGLKSAYTDLHDFFGSMNEKELLKVFDTIDKKCDYNRLDRCRVFFNELKKHGADFNISEPEKYETRFLNQQTPIHLKASNLIQDIGMPNLFDGYPLKFKKGYSIINYDFYKRPRLDRQSELYYGENAYNYIGSFDIDINGNKQPNIYGRDIYRFLILEDGTIYPYGGINYKANCRPYKNNAYNIIENTGLSCAAKIMNENWKMNY